MKKYIPAIVFKVYCCNCGELFYDRESLIIHIKRLKKGKYSKLHFAGDNCTGNKTGLIKFVTKFGKVKKQ